MHPSSTALYEAMGYYEEDTEVDDDSFGAIGGDTIMVKYWYSSQGRRLAECPELNHYLIHEAEKQLLVTEELWEDYRRKLEALSWCPIDADQVSKIQLARFKHHRSAPALVLAECLLKAIGKEVK
jgi:hypothetical protein